MEKARQNKCGPPIRWRRTQHHPSKRREATTLYSSLIFCKTNKGFLTMPMFSLFSIFKMCEQYTHKNSTCRVAQHDHIFITRTRVAQELEGSGLHMCPKHNCHPRVMSHSLPHLTLTTSTSSLSPISSTSPICPTVSPTHTRPMALDPHLPCDVPLQSGGSIQNPISHRL